MCHDSNIVRLRFPKLLSPEARALLLRGFLAQPGTVVIFNHRSPAPSLESHTQIKTEPEGLYDTDDDPPQPAHRPRKKARQEAANDITEAPDYDSYSLSDFVVSDSESSDTEFVASETDDEGSETGPQKEASKSQAMDSSASKRKPWVDKSIATKRSLRREYLKNKYPTEERKEQLAARFNVDTSQINTWFVSERKHRGDNRRVPGPLPKVGSKTGQAPACSASGTPRSAQTVGVGADHGVNGQTVPLQEAGPSRAFVTRPEAPLPLKIEAQQGDLQIKTENGFVDVKLEQTGVIGDKIAKWDRKRVDPHLEVHQAFEKVQLLHTKQTMLQKKFVQAKQAIQEHKEKIMEAERVLSEAERPIVENSEELKRAEAEHGAKKEKLDNIMEILDDLRS